VSDEGDDVKGADDVPLPGMEPPQEVLTPYDGARKAVAFALTLTRDRLRELRANRDEINAEIKMLVAEEQLLTRMAKVQEK
jgi:hypothetical protein